MKHKKLDSGLEITSSGRLHYPKDLCVYDNDGWHLNENEPKPGDKIWEWNHTRKMSKRSVGEVISSRQIGPADFWITTITNLKGDIIEIYENMILTDDQYNEAKSIL